MSVFETRLTQAACRAKPSWAVIATEDKAFDQAMLVHMAKRMEAKSIYTQASHAVYKTRGDIVAGAIDQAAHEAHARTND